MLPITQTGRLGVSAGRGVRAEKYAESVMTMDFRMQESFLERKWKILLIK